MFLHLSVILSMGGVWISACWDTPPLGKHPTPLGRHPPGQMPHLGRPPWADTPSWQTLPQQMASAADSTHPTGMHSCYIQCLHKQFIPIVNQLNPIPFHFILSDKFSLRLFSPKLEEKKVISNTQYTFPSGTFGPNCALLGKPCIGGSDSPPSPTPPRVSKFFQFHAVFGEKMTK